MDRKDYYTILQISPTATPEEIRRNFRRLSKLHHPDRRGNEARFRELVEAYEILRDPQKRNEYDRKRRSPGPVFTPPPPPPSSGSWLDRNLLILMQITFWLVAVGGLAYLVHRASTLPTAAPASPIPDLIPASPRQEKKLQKHKLSVDSVEKAVDLLPITQEPIFQDADEN